MGAAYAALTAAIQAAASFAPASEGKIGRSLRARRGLVTRLSARARAVRDPSRPLVWMHAPSVGEGLQARPVLEALRGAHPTWQFAYTFFSPSAERFAESLAVDISDYLPFDRAGNADALLDALRPSIIVFSKLDVWPVLVARASMRRIPVVLISATIAERSGRRGWWSRQVLHDAYAALASVGAIDDTNAQRLQSIGVRRETVSVAGDTRFDQVWTRAQASSPRSPLLALLASPLLTVVAGSTWPADETALLAAWNALRAPVTVGEPAPPVARLVIAPHEPTNTHCAAIEQWAHDSSLELRRLSAIEAGASTDNVDVVLVDRVGVLGDLYALADIAFVGGGFHSAGLHSVIEPAAFGVPVLFGPQHDMSREAQLLLGVGAAYSVTDASVLRTQLAAWLADRQLRERAGMSARDVVQRELGATARATALIEDVMNRHPLPVRPPESPASQVRPA